MSDSIRVFDPATVANVACAFDVLGFAIENPGDEVVARRSSIPGVQITRITGDNGRLPLDASKNTAGVSAQAFLKHIGAQDGIELELHKGMGIGSGLGSSSASTVAAVVAANELFGHPLSRQQLLPFAMEGERAACGAAHADNAAPALLGGFVLIRSYTPLDTVSLGAPGELYSSVVSPQVEVRTEDARKILRKHIAFKDAIVQWGNIGGLITGIIKADYELISRSLRDVLVEPERAVLIPGFDQVKKAAIGCGVLGCSISGSGPSVFALSRSQETAETAAAAMQQAFRAAGIDALTFCSKINTQGAKVLP